MPYQVHSQEDQDHAGVQAGRDDPQASIVEAGGGAIGASPKQKPQHLPAPVRLCAVDRHDAEQRQHADQQKLEVVEPPPCRDGCQIVPARMAPTLSR